MECCVYIKDKQSENTVRDQGDRDLASGVTNTPLPREAKEADEFLGPREWGMQAYYTELARQKALKAQQRRVRASRDRFNPF